MNRNRGPRGEFNEPFGYDPSDVRDGIAGSIPQVLAMMNSPQVAGGAHAGRGVLKRLDEEIADNDALAVELYLQTLNREPTDAELALALTSSTDVGARPDAAADLMWALLHSAEFPPRR